MEKFYRIYNLYPKLVGTVDKWIKELPRIKKMNFDYVYVNPFHLTGESNSDYSVKDYYQYNPLYLTKKNLSKEENMKLGDELITKFCNEANKRGMQVMMDLVINHTATDSPLVLMHDNWYLHEDGKIANPFCMDGETKVVWKDLAEIDNLHSPDRDNLWKYWLDMILHFCKLGIRGFRCDAVFMIPTQLWSYLITNVRAQYPDTLFLGETLGCSPEQTLNTLKSGFDMAMTAFKWWDFNGSWFTEQYNETIKYGMTLSFPENHDSERCANEYKGNPSLVGMKYLLSAYISKASAITTGFEYGYRRKIDVCNTNTSWNEAPYFNLEDLIGKVNKLKEEYPILNTDSYINSFKINNLVCIVKYYNDEALILLCNPNNEPIEVTFNPYDIIHKGNLTDISITGNKLDLSYNTKACLFPGDVKIILGK